MMRALIRLGFCLALVLGTVAARAQVEANVAP